MPLIVEIKVMPSSGRQKIIFDKTNNLKCFLKSPPEDGKANAELIKFLSKQLKIHQKQITIISGTTSRKKRVLLDEEISFEQFCEHLKLKQ